MKVFFYGLFMDTGILAEKGVVPTEVRTGYVRDYALRIGKRATLEPRPGAVSYGLCMTLDAEGCHRLYAAPGLEDYQPVPMQVHGTEGESLEAICYILPPGTAAGTNAAYARELWKLARELQFPEDYIEEIQSMADQTAHP